MNTKTETTGRDGSFTEANGYVPARFEYRYNREDGDGEIYRDGHFWEFGSKRLTVTLVDANDEVVRLRERCRIHEANCAALEKAWYDQGREIDALRKDKARLDWIADTGNGFASLQLPGECVRRNLHSMRAAIDDAMAMQKAEAHNNPELSDGAKPKEVPNV